MCDARLCAVAIGIGLALATGMSPLVRGVVALIAGCVAGSFVALTPEMAVRAAGLALACLIVCARLGWGGHARVAIVGAMAGALGLGAALTVLAEDRAWAPRNIDIDALADATSRGDIVVLSGVARRDAWLSDTGAPSLDLRVDGIKWDGRWHATDVGVRLTISGDAAVDLRDTWTRGRRVEAPVSSLRRPLPYRNFGMPDAERVLARRGIRVFATVKSASLVDTQPAPWWEERAADARHAIRSAVARHVDDPIAAATVTAILIGDRSRLPDTLVRDLQHAGVYHVVAISGGNVAIWLALLLWLPHAAGAGTRVGMAWLAAGLLVFAVIVDGGASVARAVSVAALVVAARWWDIRIAGAQALAVAGAMQIAIDPLAIHDPGCVLSFGAAGTLIFIASWPASESHAAFGTRPSWARRLGTATAMMVLATCLIELVLLPISARWFSIATAAGLLANLLAVPAMAVVQVTGLGLLAAAVAWPWAAVVLGAISATGVHALLRSADILVVAPWLVREVPAPSIAVLGAYYAALGVALTTARAIVGARRHAGLRTRLRSGVPTLAWACAAGTVTSLACLTWIVTAGVERSAPSPWTWPVASHWQHASWPHEHWLLITMLDVGQGDATVVRFPSGRTWLVDAGGSMGESFDIGARVTTPALWALGHRRIDRVVVTHPHPDHAGGMSTVIRRLAPRELLMGVPVEGDPHQTALVRAAASRGTRIRWVATGESLAEGPVSVQVRHPERPDWDRPRVRNDDSVVLWIRLGDVGILLPGDIGAQVESHVAARVTPAPISVLRLAHHGSASSTTRESLETLDPALAIVSAGRGNRFGHPAPSVLRRLHEAGTGVLRTDRDGAIQLATNGRVVLVRTATGGAMSLPSRR
ncbi:MAG: ComEC/Rec2 family competence protein [Acidobacteria bacterium]|nr:ComEC/Rec2 family competence protein [Acidobacteriota bacterium]